MATKAGMIPTATALANDTTLPREPQGVVALLDFVEDADLGPAPRCTVETGAELIRCDMPVRE